MNTYSLKSYLSNNDEMIELVLRKSGFHYIDGDYSHGTEFRCAWDEDSNPTSIRINKETLSVNAFSKGIKGDIITLIREKKKFGHTKALNYISSIVDFTLGEASEYELPFGGFFKEVSKSRNHNIEIETYSNDIIKDYSLSPSLLFLRDGISCDVQNKFKIGYDSITKRITIPWHNKDNELVGIMGRLNKSKIEDFESKYLPIIKFSKSNVLFGLNVNREYIEDKSGIFIFESEKATMQLATNGINLGVSIGGSNVSVEHSNIINSMMLDTIILCMDEGMDEDTMIENCKILKINGLYSNNVGYVYDENNEYLPKGSKCSPIDLGIEVFNNLIKNKVKWI